MKKSLMLLTAVIVLTSSVPAFAHCGMCDMDDKGSMKGSAKGDWAKGKIEKLTEGLDLSEDQAGQLKALMETKMEKKKAVHEEAEEKMEAIRAEYEEGLKGILTAEQLEKYEAKMDKKGSGHDHKGSMNDDKGSMHDHKGSQHDHKGSK
ncbi:MAG: hypothetical protein KC618_00270 [Candidatus Omnitrophica bacterium]|nr:hypothetical protein [Candidatus Omnitrophota bacterium]